MLSTRDRKDHVAPESNRTRSVILFTKKVPIHDKIKHENKQKTIRDKIIKDTSDHIWCYSFPLSCQLKCPGLHNMCLCLVLQVIGNPQSGWCRHRHKSFRQPRTITLYMSSLISMKENQCTPRAVPTHMNTLSTSKQPDLVARHSPLCCLLYFPQRLRPCWPLECEPEVLVFIAWPITVCTYSGLCFV